MESKFVLRGARCRGLSASNERSGTGGRDRRNVIKVLLTCAGRRNYLIRYFKEALAGRGLVLACDSSDHAPALLGADFCFLVPSLDHPDYYNRLEEICNTYDVGLLIPVHDLELDLLATHADRLRSIGTYPLISPPEVVAVCQDKWASYQLLKLLDIATPDTYPTLAAVCDALDQGQADYPLLIKPRWGVSSIGVELIRNERELELAFEWGLVQLQRTMLDKLRRAEPDRCFIFQQHLHGQEYGMDVINDLDGRHRATVARRKLVMCAGNTDRAVSVEDPHLAHIGRRLAERLRHVGCLDVDVMETADGFFVIDLNPRIGGGYPFSHEAGADLPSALIAWAEGAEHDPTWFQPRPGVVSSKYDEISLMQPVVTSPTGRDDCLAANALDSVLPIQR